MGSSMSSRHGDTMLVQDENDRCRLTFVSTNLKDHSSGYRTLFNVVLMIAALAGAAAFGNNLALQFDAGAIYGNDTDFWLAWTFVVDAFVLSFGFFAANTQRNRPNRNWPLMIFIVIAAIMAAYIALTASIYFGIVWGACSHTICTSADTTPSSTPSLYFILFVSLYLGLAVVQGIAVLVAYLLYNHARSDEYKRLAADSHQITPGGPVNGSAAVLPRLGVKGMETFAYVVAFVFSLALVFHYGNFLALRFAPNQIYDSSTTAGAWRFWLAWTDVVKLLFLAAFFLAMGRNIPGHNINAHVLAAVLFLVQTLWDISVASTYSALVEVDCDALHPLNTMCTTTDDGAMTWPFLLFFIWRWVFVGFDLAFFAFSAYMGRRVYMWNRAYRKAQKTAPTTTAVGIAPANETTALLPRPPSYPIYQMAPQPGSNVAIPSPIAPPPGATPDYGVIQLRPPQPSSNDSNNYVAPPALTTETPSYAAAQTPMARNGKPIQYEALPNDKFYDAMADGVDDVTAELFRDCGDDDDVIPTNACFVPSAVTPAMTYGDVLRKTASSVGTASAGSSDKGVFDRVFTAAVRR
jgi:hypothetical protein